jgi:hypothetical protein
MAYTLHHADCMEWLDAQPENSFEAIITDPPTSSLIPIAPILYMKRGERHRGTGKYQHHHL